jgi:RND family efflux transporter MFP subunit
MPDEIVAQPPRGLGRLGLGAAAVALIVAAAGFAVRAHDADTARATSEGSTRPTVQMIAPLATGKAQPLTLPGTLQAWTQARIFARVPGYVRAWYHDIGARVGAGTPLGAIDTPELDQQIIEARATLGRAQAEAALARTTAARWNDLLTTASVSRQEADEKNGAAATRAAAVREAQAALGRLLAMKSYGTVRAPFAGIVTARSADIGDLVGPGASNQQPLFGMADEHRIRTYVDVPQQYVAGIVPGLRASLSVPEYPGRTFAAVVSGASGAIDPHSGTLQVELETDNAQHLLRAGGYAQVRFDLSGGAGVTLPATALVLRGSGTKVATVTPQGRIHLLPVTIGRDLGSTVEISSGLATGTRVVDNPPDSLSEGEAVTVTAAHG